MKSKFKKNKYLIIKKAITKEVADFTCKYFSLRKDIFYYIFKKTNQVPDVRLGAHGDSQVKDTYSQYADPVMETLLKLLLPLMEKNTGLKLYPTYSYARIYKKGDDLKKHRDRPSCEISTTLNLGGDPWSIYLEPKIKVDLNPGDMLIYRGCDLAHWRNPFKGKSCCQVFLHYNEKNGPFKNTNVFDGRPMIGIHPADVDLINRILE